MTFISPVVGSPFGALAPIFQAKPPAVSEPDTAWPDRFNMSKPNNEVPPISDVLVSTRQALGLFSSGLLLVLGGAWVFKSKLAQLSQKLFKAGATDSLAKEELREFQTFISHNDLLSVLGRVLALSTEIPAARTLRNNMLALMGTVGLGYLAGNVLDGTQESVVRQQETHIRFKLLERLQQTFRQSIRLKNQIDERLKTEAKTRLAGMLKQHHVNNAWQFLHDVPVPEALIGASRNYFYEPIPRTLALKPTFSGQQIGDQQTPEQASSPQSSSPFSNITVATWLKTSLAAAGALLGGVVLAGLRLFKGTNTSLERMTVKGMETINVQGMPAVFLLNLSKNPVPLLICLALGGLAKLGKTMISGLREVEVTQVNADTEFRYQQQNMLMLDPGYHEISEREALENSLRWLNQNMACLVYYPQLLKDWIQTTLGNIGRHSAPNYFMMTPAVGLQEARN